MGGSHSSASSILLPRVRIPRLFNLQNGNFICYYSEKRKKTKQKETGILKDYLINLWIHKLAHLLQNNSYNDKAQNGHTGPNRSIYIKRFIYAKHEDTFIIKAATSTELWRNRWINHRVDPILVPSLHLSIQCYQNEVGIGKP